MQTYLDRYINGEFEQVWTDLLAQGNAIREEPLFSDAIAVATETMERVRYNISVIISRLDSLGYIFGTYPDKKTKVPGYTTPHHLPKPEIGQQIIKFEALDGIGSIPLSLRMFWTIVGDINLIGYYPHWPKYTDPLVIYPIDVIKFEHAEWKDAVQAGDIEIGKFGIPLSPDYYHKDCISGGAPYQIRVPNSNIDAVLEYERSETTFVNYLRICFRFGGFPGLKWYKGDLEELPRLIDGLLPI